MKTRNLIITLVSSVFLAGYVGMTSASPQSPASASATKAKQEQKSTKAKAPVTNVSRGTITSIDSNKLVLSQKNKKTGKTEQTTYVLGSDTSRLGYPTVGNEAIVHYRSQNNSFVATSVLGVQKTPKSKTSKG